jgi:hypothetical protein
MIFYLLPLLVLVLGLGLCTGPPAGNPDSWFHYNNTWEGKGLMEACTCHYGGLVSPRQRIHLAIHDIY